jgi:hypothetical protein
MVKEDIVDASEEQHEQDIYARWLAAAVRLGFGAVAVSFVIYLSGVLAPGIPPSELPKYWGLSVGEYVKATGAPTGWHWVLRLKESDLLNLVGVAILCISTLACYLRILPFFISRRERVFVAICVAEIVVLAVAMSGIVSPH